jgi:hypothetical protein
MPMEQRPICVTSNGEQLVLTAAVTPAPDGSWVTEIELGDGVKVTNRLADESEARQYPDKLAAWLRHRQGS